MRKTLVIVALLALAFVTAGCEKKAKEEAAKPGQPAVAKAPEDPVIIKVNGSEVRLSEFQAAVESIPEQMRGPLGSTEGKKVLAEELVRMKVLEMEGTRLGLDREPDVSGRIAVARANILANAAVQKLTQQSQLTPQQLYDKTKTQYETAKVRQILVPYTGSVSRPKDGKVLSEPEAKRRAEELVTQLRGGADFAKLATKESSDPSSAPKGGDLGELTRGMLPPDLGKAVFSLQPNAISDPVRSRLGYHIFRVESKSVKSFDEMKPYLEQQGEKIEAEQIIEDLRQKAKVEFDPKFFPEGGTPAATATQ